MKFFTKKSENLLDPSTSSSGIRVANNVPVFIVAGIFVVLILIIAFVMNNRANQTVHEKEEAKQPTGTEQFAKEVSGSWGGLIPPDQLNTPATTETNAMKDNENTNKKEEKKEEKRQRFSFRSSWADVGANDGATHQQKSEHRSHAANPPRIPFQCHGDKGYYV